MSSPKISIDQWTALVSVVESGGYEKAGERLHKSQSTLSYSVKKLEQLLDVKVFELQGRKSVLTPAGTLLYRRAKALVDDAARVERAAQNLARGCEAEVRLAVDMVFPTWLLLECLSTFGAEHPDTRIELYETVLGGHEEALLERRVDLSIGGNVPAGFLGDALMPVRFVCAASPAHPLHRLGRAITLDDLREHRHLVIRDSSAQRARSVGWLNETRWTVTNKATSIRAAVLGLGFAWYPEESIREELDAGTLAPLPLVEGAERHTTLYLVLADADLAGPGARELAEVIRRSVQRSCRAVEAEARAAAAAGATGQ